jgi:heptosyltransferase-2
VTTGFDERRHDRLDVQPPGFLVHYDCRHYNGYRPCGLNPVCQDCDKYDPISHRVLIIKLGAMGDVLRTTPTLQAIRRDWPGSHITWITRPESHGLLKNNPLIDRLFIWDTEAATALRAFEFDLILNFEKEIPPLALGEVVRARERRGFRLTSNGAVGIADERAGYALQMGLDDDLKFNRNTLCHQQITFEMVGFDWDGSLYLFEPDAASIAARDAFRAAHARLARTQVVGINTGCGAGFPTKQWSEANIEALIRKLGARADTSVLLLGGDREEALNRRLAQRCGDLVIDTGCDNTLDEFVGALMVCDAVVSADSLPMHLGIALGKAVVALFGATSATEVNLGPLGEKVVATIECSPCYLTRCDKTPDGHPLCMEEMAAGEVFAAVERVLARAAGESPHAKP